jgi:ketosteroid isomerase-like protein
MIPEPNPQNAGSTVAAVRQDWLEAANQVTPNGWQPWLPTTVLLCMATSVASTGREGVECRFSKGFEAFAIEQSVSSAEIVVRGQWAFDISEVDSRFTPHL